MAHNMERSIERSMAHQQEQICSQQSLASSSPRMESFSSDQQSSQLLTLRPKPKLRKINPGCCACCNEKFCGGKTCDKRSGFCRMWNCCNCCDRGRVLVRRNTLLDQNHLDKILKSHEEFQKQKEWRCCC